MITTERLAIRMASEDEMRRFIDEQTDMILRTAYREMLQGCLDHPDQREWYAIWMIELRDGTHIGDLSFKGLNADGSAEIGYGISEEHQGRGYATEAVRAAVDWALRQPGVTCVEAETEPDNMASQRVLEKSGFLPSGVMGEEGPRFVKNREIRNGRRNSIVIRPVGEDDAEGFFQMMCRLDDETEYMMYEPGERRDQTKDPSRLRNVIRAAQTGGDLLLAAVDSDEIVGFIWAERGKTNRVRHTAYIVVGVRSSYRSLGIGTEFFRRMDGWAKACGIIRLELTVECDNSAAVSLYRKCGFAVEGVRPKSMNVSGRLVDEYYMGKLLG